MLWPRALDHTAAKKCPPAREEMQATKNQRERKKVSFKERIDMETIDLPIPETSERSSVLNRKPGWGKFTQCQIAKTLFSCPDFASRPFSQMDIQDWRLQASRAWDIAWVFVEEMAKRYDGFSDPTKGKDPDGFKTDGVDGRTRRRIASQIDDVLALIPADSFVLRKDLYEQTRGKMARDSVRSYVVQLLREERIFVHEIPGRTRPLVAYCQKAPAASESL